jgi:hypothetical protein
MAGRMYTVVISGAPTGTIVMDLLELNPSSTKPIRIRRLRIAQTSEAMSEEEQVPLTIVRGHTTSGNGGTGFDVTPAPLTSGIPGASFTAEAMNQTQASGGSPVVLLEEAWNTRAGLDLAFSSEEAPSSVNERLVVRSGGQTDAITVRATFWIEELG